MKIIVCGVALTIICFSITAQAQMNPQAPGPEHKKLAVFVGTWTGAGKTETSPLGKGGPTTSVMTCTMFMGGYHLICDSDDSGPSGKIKGRSIYGYNVDKKQYYTFGIDSMGFGGPGTARVEGSTWTFEGNDTVGGKPIWFRTAVILTTPKELTYKSEFSENGKVWKPMADGKMVKK